MNEAIVRVSRFRNLVLIGGYAIFRCWPCQIMRVECVSLSTPSANPAVMDLTLLMEMASFLRYIMKVYLTIPAWSSKQYPFIDRRPPQAHKPLPFLETETFSVTVRIHDVPPQSREQLERILRENGAFLNIEGGWRHRIPVRKHFKLK